jgi:6-phosphogluconolactonase (cycloisomerase 2 family)
MRKFSSQLFAIACLLLFFFGTVHGASIQDTAGASSTSCTYHISPKSKTLSYTGGAINVRITAKGSSCSAPDVSLNEDWISLSSLTFSNNRGTLALTIPENASSLMRKGTVSIGGNTFTVSQKGEPCTVALSAASSGLFPENGGTGEFTVITRPNDCLWTAKSSASWLWVTSGRSGAGVSDIFYMLGAYKGKGKRNGKITVKAAQSKKSASYAVHQSNTIGSLLQGNPAFRAGAVAGYQALGAGVSYTVAALKLALPSGSPLNNLTSANVPAVLRKANAIRRAGAQVSPTYSFMPELNLYTDNGIINGNVVTIGYFIDSAGTTPAGAVTITYPADIDTSDPTNYPSYPAVVEIAINITGGNIPCVGNIQVIFTGASGANTITGTNTLTNNGVVFNLGLALSDQFQVSGSITVEESGATLLLTNVQGNMLSPPYTCDITAEPYGWTGTGSIDIFTGAISASLNTGTGTSTAASDGTNLDINYADGTQEIVVNAPSAPLTVTEGITPAGGTPQSAAINTAFTSPLSATVTDSDGNPISGVTVTFTAPSSGASGSFAGGAATAVTNASGVATSAIFTANGTAGSYTVTATAQGVTGSASFALTNLAVGPAVGFAYVTSGAGFIMQYSIGADGKLNAMPAVSDGSYPTFITADPSGEYAYVTNAQNDTVSQFSIGADGQISTLNPAEFTAGITPAPGLLTFDPSGKYAYLAGGLQTILQYTMGATGALSPMAPASAPVVSGSYVSSIAVDPSGKYAYAATGPSTGDGTVSQYTLGPGGALTPMNPTTVASGWDPGCIAVDPSSRFVYVTNVGGVSQYAIGSGGALTPMNPPTVSMDGAVWMSVHPSGKYAYVANSGYYGSVSQFTIDQTTGALTAMNPPTVAAGSYPASISVDPSGKFAYVANNNELSVSQYTIDQSSGALSPMNPPTVETPYGSPHLVITVGARQ